MKSLLTPRNVSTLQPFQPGTVQALEKVELAGIHANTSKDGKVTWLYHGPSLEVLSTNTRERLASWQFGAVLKDVGTFVTSVKELSYDGSLKLLVGLFTSTGQGMICLLDVASSQVIKAIEVPHKVSCVEPVLTHGGDSLPEWAISEQLRAFYGVVAVGTHGGYVFLIDMNLDDYDEVSDEVSPSSIQMITPRCRDLKSIREQALSNQQHLCMLLDESSHSKGEYQFRRPDDSIVKLFNIDDISITCIKYISQDGNLAVGFSFGGFQLWKLYAPVLEYTSRLEAEPAAVSHFLYQEPENDPKNFCYIWVARDNSVINIGQESISTICLYQLSYGKKTWYANYGVFFEELHSVCLRIEHNLAADPYSSSTRSTWMSQLVSCYTLKDPVYSPPTLLTDNESFEESTHGPDLSLCVFVWEVQDNSPGDKSLFYLGVFDMNRWYHAQMPTTIRVRESTMDLCSFFAVHQLSELCDIANPDSLLHVEIKTDSLKRYINNSPLTPEQHFYPSALAFDAVCIFESGTITATFHGRQRQVLYDMEARGPISLLQPQDLYNICLCAGLLPRDLTAHSTSQTQQRHSLLNMALDHSMMRFINNCILSWGSGEFVQQGCTLKFLLDWAWDRVAATKHNIDQACTPLYDWSGNLVDHRLLQVLNRSKVTLQHLRSIVLTLLTQSAPTTEQGVLELETRLNVIHYLSQHLQLVQWFIDAGLLPESDEAGDEVEGLFTYPAGNLIQAFNSKRAALQKVHSELHPTELLMVDGLVESCGESIRDLWEREGGSGLYPPPSLHALLNVYLLEDVSIAVKHSIVFYLLLDLTSLVEENKHEQFADKIGKFAKSFSLPLSIVRQIQAFWLLDHRDFEEAFFHLLHPMATMQLGTWQQGRIIKALLYQGESKLALRYINLRSISIPTQEEVKLKLTVLLANGMITEAFEYQRACRDRNNMADLLQHLFLCCQQTHTVDQLLQLPLSDGEERHLEDYLLDSNEPHSSELLVMHYLQRARYIEAIRLNEKIKHQVMTETSAKARERAAARNSIVDGFFNTLPAPQRKLVRDHPSLPKKTAGRKIDVKRPKPLSTVVTQSDRSKVISHSSLILAMMEKVHEVKREDQEEHATVPTEKDLGPFLCTPIAPAKKSRLSEVQDVVYPSKQMSEAASDRLSLSAFQLTRDPAVLNSPLSVTKSLQLTRDIARNKKKGRYSTADTMSLLQTPKVRKKSPLRPASLSIMRTPQSILKVRRLITKSPSPASSPRDASDKSTTGSRPKRLGFTEKLAAKLAQPESVSTPKQLSFASSSAPPSTSRLATGSVPSTPKHLRFVEPGSNKEKTPAKKGGLSPVSPPSPRSVRNRSPTPESLSPKMADRMDNLIRPSLRAERQRGAEEPLEVAVVEEEEEDITFNFNPTESDEMEVDEEAVTPPLEQSPHRVHDSSDSAAAASENEDPRQQVVEDSDIEIVDDDVAMEEEGSETGVRERADSTQDVERGREEVEEEVLDGGEADVTSTQNEVDLRADSSGEVELQASPARSNRSSPARSTRSSPARSLRESPARSMRSSPSRSPTGRESPRRLSRESPARSSSPPKSRESPSRQSPSRLSRESPSRSVKESPGRTRRSRESPSRLLQASLPGTSGESAEPSQVETGDKPDSVRPETPRKVSPGRHREQSWLKMESPVKVYDELFEESPGKSTRSATKKIMEDVTTVTRVTQVTVTTRRVSRESGHASPSRAEGEIEDSSPERPKSPGRTKPKASPSRRKPKKESPEKAIFESEGSSPERPKSASPRRTQASPGRRKSKKAAEVDDLEERAGSASPSRGRASPARRKSRMTDEVSTEPVSPSKTKSPARSRGKGKHADDTEMDTSPTRAGSASPARGRSSRGSVPKSPARGRKKVTKAEEEEDHATHDVTSTSPGPSTRSHDRPEPQLENEKSPQPPPSARASRKSTSSSKSPGRGRKAKQTEASPGKMDDLPSGSKSPGRGRKPKQTDSSTERAEDTSTTKPKSPGRGRKPKTTHSSPEREEAKPTTSKSPGRGRRAKQADASPEKMEEAVSKAKSPGRGRRSKKTDVSISPERPEEASTSKSQSRGKQTKKTDASPERMEEASTSTSIRGRRQKQMTKLKDIEKDVSQPLTIDTNISDSEIGPVSPIRRSPRLMIKTLDKQLTDSEDEGQTDTVIASRAVIRRTASSRKQQTKISQFKTPPRPTKADVPLTPPESGKESPDKTDEAKSQRKSPARKSVASGRHSTRTRTKNVTMVTGASTSMAPGDISSSNFQFSEPMALDPELQARLAEPGTPVKSFIFSPPITRKRPAPSVASEDPPSPVISLLPPVAADTEAAGPSQKPKTRKAVKKDPVKKKKVVEPPPASPSDSPINFVSPAPRRRTRASARQSGESTSTSSTSTAAVPTRAVKTRKKVARLY